MSRHVSTVSGRTASHPVRALGEFVLKAVALPFVLLELYVAWADKRRSVRRLRSLDDRMLRDIGISRSDVEHYAQKPVVTRR